MMYASESMKNINVAYASHLHDIDINDISFIPNISFFKYKLIKAIIKQNIVEIFHAQIIYTDAI